MGLRGSDTCCTLTSACCNSYEVGITLVVGQIHNAREILQVGACAVGVNLGRGSDLRCTLTYASWSLGSRGSLREGVGYVVPSYLC